MKVSGFLLFILIFSSFFGSRCEATVYHSNGSAANVQQIHNTQAVDGDTITLPAGTFVWTGMVIITKSITIQGQTTVNWIPGCATIEPFCRTTFPPQLDMIFLFAL